MSEYKKVSQNVIEFHLEQLGFWICLGVWLIVDDRRLALFQSDLLKCGCNILVHSFFLLLTQRISGLISWGKNDYIILCKNTTLIYQMPVVVIISRLTLK